MSPWDISRDYNRKHAFPEYMYVLDESNPFEIHETRLFDDSLAICRNADIIEVTKNQERNNNDTEEYKIIQSPPIVFHLEETLGKTKIIPREKEHALKHHQMCR